MSFYTITSFPEFRLPVSEEVKCFFAFVRLGDFIFYARIRLWGGVRGACVCVCTGMAIWKKAFSDGCLLPYSIMGEVYVSLVFMAGSEAMGINKTAHAQSCE